jgi:hypothetical protein
MSAARATLSGPPACAKRAVPDAGPVAISGARDSYSLALSLLALRLCAGGLLDQAADCLGAGFDTVPSINAIYRDAKVFVSL